MMWRDVSDDVAERACDMDDGDVMLLESSRDDRYVQVTLGGPGWVRAEVSSNLFNRGAARLDESQMSALVHDGWHMPAPEDPSGSPNFWIDVEQLWADVLGDMVARVVDDVWKLPTTRLNLDGEPYIRGCVVFEPKPPIVRTRRD